MWRTSSTKWHSHLHRYSTLFEGDQSYVLIKLDHQYEPAMRLDKYLTKTLHLSREYILFLFEQKQIFVCKEREQKYYQNQFLEKENYKEIKQISLDHFQPYSSHKSIPIQKINSSILLVHLSNREGIKPKFVVNNNTTTFKDEKLEIPYHLIDPKQRVLLENEWALFWNKPSGYAVHSGKGNPYQSTILYHISQMYERVYGKSDQFIGFAHRLDKETSGALLCAKTKHALQFFSQQLSEKVSTDDGITPPTTKKRYLAICAIATTNSKKIPDLLLERKELDDDYDDVEEDESFSKHNHFQSSPTSMDEIDDTDSAEPWDHNEKQLLSTEMETKSLPNNNSNRKFLFTDDLYGYYVKPSITVDARIATQSAFRYSIGSMEEMDYEYKLEKAKESKSLIHIVDVNLEKKIALVVVDIETGRTHQIRSHLASIEMPVLGDLQYGLMQNRLPLQIALKLNVNRMLLHCWQLRVKNLIKEGEKKQKNLEVMAPLTPELEQIIQAHFDRRKLTKFE